jgi:zinc protease
MKNKKLVGGALACAFMLANSLSAFALSLPKPLIPISEDFTLKNGLRVILSEDHSAPVASVVLVYNVGSRDEVKGRSGFAHLFEHMMFQGSENVAKSEHFKIVGDAGGQTNASTHHDFTDYFERVPSNEVKMALWLEADRMRSLQVTQKNFTNQLETVKEEKRLRIDNQPYGLANLRVDEVVFDNWSNAHPVIGSFEDLDNSSIEDVRNFWKTHYAPNNCVMAVVGDIDPKAVHATIEKYFSDIPSQPKPAEPDVAEPPTTKPRYELIKDKLADSPGFWMEWKVPPQRSPEYFAFLVMSNILSSGESSRLYQRMIKGDQIALSADAGLDARRGPSEWGVFSIFKPNTTAEKARDVVWSEIDRIKNEPVSEKELKKAQNQIMRGFFSSNSNSSLQKTLSRANMLARYAAFWGDPKLIDQDVEAVMKVTPQDIQAAAQKFLTRDSVTVIDVVPDKQTAQLPKSGEAH